MNLTSFSRILTILVIAFQDHCTIPQAFGCDFSGSLIQLAEAFPGNQDIDRMHVAVHEYSGMLGRGPGGSYPERPYHYFNLLTDRLHTPSAVQMIHKLLAKDYLSPEHPEFASRMSHFSQLIIVTHQNPALDSQTNTFIQNNPDAFALLMGSGKFPVPKSMLESSREARSRGVIHSRGGELNISANLILPQKINFLGGFCQACQTTTVQAVVTRFLNNPDQRELDIVIERSLSYELRNRGGETATPMDQQVQLYLPFWQHGRFENVGGQPKVFNYQTPGGKKISVRFNGDDWFYLR